MMKDRILRWLKEGEKSTSELSSLLRRNHYDMLEALRELKKEGKIKEIKKKKYVYWELKK